MTQQTPPIRYSPRSLESYADPRWPTPASDSRVKEPEIWNLAYLSFDYDRAPFHQDPVFLTHVRRTCQYDFKKGRVDMQGYSASKSEFIGSLLLRPAPWFVKWLESNRRVMVSLPLYEAYGSQWLSTIEQRARTCHTYDHLLGPMDQITTCADAQMVLMRFCKS